MKSLILILLIIVLAGCKSTSVNKLIMLSASVGMKLSTAYDYYVNKKFDDALKFTKNIRPKTDYDRAFLAYTLSENV
ncbi:MAG: hypothetical protein HRU25_10970 [Psychrobium sp.]|nr:hypothetical protein [Psychrobium sp.]